MKIFRFKIILFILAILFATSGCSKKNTTEGTGLQFTDKSTLEKVTKAKPPPFIGGSKLPAQVDLSKNMPPPGNQGQQNSCVGWSIAYGMKSYQEKEARNWDLVQGETIDKDHVFSPAFIYNQINHGQDNGSRFQDAFNLLQSKGVASLAKDPYDQADFTSKPNDDAVSEATNFRIAWAKQIDPKDIESLKSYLAKGYPIIIAIAFDNAFTDPKGSAVVSSMQVDANSMGHAMLLVGYDDSKSAFKVMNSWGTDWREGGFCWFTYDGFKQFARECWIAKDEEGKKEIKKDDEPQVSDNTPIVDEVLSNLTINNVENDAENPEDKSLGKCLKITGSVKLDNNYGDAAQIVVFLNYSDGNPVQAADQNYSYEEGVAAATPSMDIKSDNDQNIDFVVYIPYSALKIDKEKSAGIFATPVLFIDDFDADVGKLAEVKIAE